MLRPALLLRVGTRRNDDPPMVNPCQPSAMHPGIRCTSIAPILLVMVMAISRGLATAQSLSPQPEAPLPPTIAVPERSEDGPSTLMQHGPVDREVTSLCSLHLANVIPQPSAKVEGASLTETHLSYTPLSAHCKFRLFLTTTYSPYTFASAGFQATEAQATGQWPHYGGGMQGWGKRFGATLANTESRRFIQGFALSTIFHQDPRYFPALKRTLFSRAWYAATRVVITKNDRGDSTFNSSEFLGALLTSALQNSYYPRHDRTLGDTMNRFGGALSSDAIGDLLREFTPDMKRLFRKHAPKKILKIEEKLPIPAEDKP
jgi:hypothetical protein